MRQFYTKIISHPVSARARPAALSSMVGKAHFWCTQLSGVQLHMFSFGRVSTIQPQPLPEASSPDLPPPHAVGNQPCLTPFLRVSRTNSMKLSASEQQTIVLSSTKIRHILSPEKFMMVLTTLDSVGDEPGRALLHTLDIVVVHGLNGDPLFSWTHPVTKAFWPQDFLPLDIPEARVMTFGYNATAAFGNTTADIVDHAKDLLGSLLDKREIDEEQRRPIIFIAHSLGGIVVKQALLSARIESQYSSINESTVGIIFFGTPHTGSEKAAYGKILGSVASAMINKPSSKLLSALQSNSDILARLTSDFRHQLPQYQIVTFYETRPMGLFKKEIVEKQSALLQVAGEDQQPINANHRDMCKFAARDDENYEKLFKRIRRMLKAKNRNEASKASSGNKFYFVPHNVSASFTGRDDVFTGAFFWIDCSTIQAIEQGFIKVARFFKIEENINATRTWFSNISNNWLLLFDNADDASIDISRYFPSGGRGTIVITTRNPECRVHQTVGSYEFSGMKTEEAITLLLKLVGKENSSQHEYEAAKSVVSTLSNLALAIIQAGAAIRQNLCRLEDYSPGRALELLRIFCFLHYDGISEEIFKQGWQNLENGSDLEYTALGQIRWLYKGDLSTWDPYTFREAIVLLSSFSLIKIDEFNNFSLHPLVHIWARDRLNAEEQIKAAALTALILANSISFGDEVFDFIYRRSLLSHILCCMKHFKLQNKTIHSQEEEIIIASKFAQVYVDSGQWRNACELREEVLEARKRTLGDEHPDTLLSMNNLASSYSDLGRMQEAVKLKEKVLKAGKRTFGDEHPKTLTSMNNLASSYSDLGRMQEAVELREKVLEARKRTLGDEHPDTLMSMNNLASSYSDLGRMQAVELEEKVLEARKRTFGD
ncbi:hypothetical protein B0O99DRAFT_693645 [Bisporella sp. PMI_857]|nr:hypothetical protein B0O99DRAFT_693645 [Bisporella sp. PMI_857]